MIQHNGINILDYIPRCQLAEGLIWDHRHQYLLFVDIEGCKVFIVEVHNKKYKLFNFNRKVCWIQLTDDPNNYLVGLQNELVILNQLTGNTQSVCTVLANTSTDRLNDSFVDVQGRVWFGTMSLGRPLQDSGQLFSYDTQQGLVYHDKSYYIANGPISVHEGTSLIHNDSALHMMYRYDIYNGKNGQYLSGRKFFKNFIHEDCSPDGMTVDENDRIWLALWNGWRVQCLDSNDGTALLELKLPVRYPTKPCFGSEQLNILYIGSAINSKDVNDLGGYILQYDNINCSGQIAHFFKLA